MNRYVKRMSILLLIILILLSIFVFDILIESKDVNKSIEDFKNRGELIYETSNTEYYIVRKKYDYEDTSSTILRTFNNNYVGTTGDIYISDRNPTSIFLTRWISTKAWIGHCGMICSEDGKEMLEISGNLSYEDNEVKKWPNTWLNHQSPRHIVLRVKQINNDSKKQILDISNTLLGKRYNYTFVFGSENRFYCTDLISYIYDQINININEDKFVTTGSDMITSDNTYIIYYKEECLKNNNTFYKIYYLAGE